MQHLPQRAQAFSFMKGVIRPVEFILMNRKAMFLSIVLFGAHEEFPVDYDARS